MQLLHAVVHEDHAECPRYAFAQGQGGFRAAECFRGRVGGGGIARDFGSMRSSSRWYCSHEQLNNKPTCKLSPQRVQSQGLDHNA